MRNDVSIGICRLDRAKLHISNNMLQGHTCIDENTNIPTIEGRGNESRVWTVPSPDPEMIHYPSGE